MTKSAKPAHRCIRCGEIFKTSRAFEAHAPVCTSGGKHKPLKEMTTEELMALYEASRKPKH